MYNNIAKEVKKEIEEQKNNLLNELTKLKDDDILKNWRFNGYLTARQREKKDSERRAIITQKIEKEYNKRLDKELARLAEIYNAGEVEEISIAVEWKRNPTWGHNPTATIDIVFCKDEHLQRAQTSAKASGCGYDKESTAIAAAFGHSNAVKKILYDAWEKKLPEGLTDRREAIGYGSGYGAIPYFEGGCGVSVFYKIFDNCGYTFKDVAHGKTFDAYIVTKKEGKK